MDKYSEKNILRKYRNFRQTWKGELPWQTRVACNGELYRFLLGYIFRNILLFDSSYWKHYEFLE